MKPGAKTLWMDGRLLLNAAVYYLDWSNQQIRQTFLDAQGQDSAITTNAGETEVYGVELETSFLATENWLFSGSIGYAAPEYKFFVEETFAPELGVDPPTWPATSPIAIRTGKSSSRPTTTGRALSAAGISSRAPI